MAERVINKVIISDEARFDYEWLIGGIMPIADIKYETEEYIDNFKSRFDGYYFRIKYLDETVDRMIMMFFYKAEKIGMMQMWELAGICLAEDWTEGLEESGQVRVWLKSKIEPTEDIDWVWDLRIWQAEQKRLIDEEYEKGGEKAMETVKELLKNYKLNKARVAVGNIPETEQLRADMEYLDKCIANLDDEARAIITYHYIDGKPLSVVGKRLGYVKSCIHKKRNRAVQMIELLFESK